MPPFRSYSAARDRRVRAGSGPAWRNGMTLGQLWRMRWAHLLWVLPLLVSVGPTASSAQGGGERILSVAKNAVYGGATGLLLGGVLTLVVPSEKRDDVVRWGVVVGTFAGFGYGLYEGVGQKDGFSESVRTRADARLQARRATESEAAGASARAANTPGGSARVYGITAIGVLEHPQGRKTEERPEPATGGATGRTS